MIHPTADDFGLHPDINRGIISCIEHGLIDGISAAACGAWLEELPHLAAARPHLRIGAHLMLVDGRPLTGGRRMLVKDGAFAKDVFTLALAVARGAVSPADVEQEWGAQIQQLLDLGIRLSHLNSHQHAHLLPGLWPAAARLARRYGIQRIRTSYESVWGAAARRSPWLFGHQVLSSVRYGSLSKDRRYKTLGMLCSMSFSATAVVDRLVKEVAAGREVEIMVHPGLGTFEAAKEIEELKLLKPVIALLNEPAPGRGDARLLAAECRRMLLR